MRKLEYGNGFDMDAQMKQSGPESCGQTQANGDISRDFNKVDRIRTIVRKIKTPRSARADIELTVGRGEFKVEGVVLRNRGKNSDVEHWFKSVIHSDGQIYAIESTLDPGSCVFDGPYWDVFLVVAKDNVQYYIDVEIPKNIKRAMLFTNKQCVLEDGKILFPYCTAEGKLSFYYRERYQSDTRVTKAKEWLAFAIFAVLHPYFKRKRLWLVFEKYSSNAQDNGFYFFQYCMEQAPAGLRKRIFFVIDRESPDYHNVSKYRRQVVPFMSFRHMLYSLVAKVYVASDARSHLYQWHPKPSIIRSRISKHKIFFLQHGVTAMKRVDYLFGRQGSTPMTYFLTTSKAEQDIAVERLGYDRENAPILGFSRWDVLEDHSHPENPVILLMPTWRQWLEEVDDATFLGSEYYCTYMELLGDADFMRLLEERNATLKFFIHPKFGEQLAKFTSMSPRIELVAPGTVPLNEIIMESSLLITDYSSVAWDVLYMDKPVVFFQFDQERYLDEVGSFIDLNNELPGTVCKTIDELNQGVNAYMDTGFALTQENSDKARTWFDFKDRNNRERTLKKLLEYGF